MAHLRGLTGKPVGVVGFCMGGALSLFAACTNPKDIGACVIYYGGHPKVQFDFDRLTAPVLGHWAERDDFANPNAAKIEAGAEAARQELRVPPIPGDEARLLQRPEARGLRREGRAAELGADARVLQRPPLGRRPAAMRIPRFIVIGGGDVGAGYVRQLLRAARRAGWNRPHRGRGPRPGVRRVEVRRSTRADRDLRIGRSGSTPTWTRREPTIISCPTTGRRICCSPG